MESKLTKLPMEAGIGPVSSLECIDNLLSFDKFPMLKGMDPESLFLKRRMASKLTKLPMEAGIGPVSSFKDIYNPLSFDKFPMVKGMDPESLFS